MTTQAERVNVVHTESERLKQYLTALPQDAWTKPSACTLWEVRDVVAHLSGAANLYTDGVTRGLRADTSTPQDRDDPSLFKTRSQEERRQRAQAAGQRGIANRERFGGDLLSAFGQAWDRFHHLAASLSAHDWHTPCYHPRGLMPARSLVNTGVFELAIHGWDIRSALEPSAPLSPEALVVMLEFFSECLHWFFAPDVRLATPLRYRFALTGARSSQWDIVVEGDTAAMAPAAPALPATVTFSCDAEMFALLLCGRRGLDAVIAGGQMIPEGDTASMHAFKKWFERV